MSKLAFTQVVVSIVVLWGLSLQSSMARDSIEMVGSSTVYPFATVAAERFGRGGAFQAPRVESTGTGGGMKLFCRGTGVETPDIANASRRIKKEEIALCEENGVTGIIEVPIGHDGIVMAQSKKAQSFMLMRRDIFLALARDIPAANDGELIPNPYKMWSEVNPELPALAIRVYGPPPTSGTRDAFTELAMEGGCKSFAWVRALEKQDKARYKAICHALREDGPYIEVGENDNIIVQKLVASPDSLGIFGYSFLAENLDRVRGLAVENTAPEFDAIADSSYPVSRTLFLYVKKAHIGIVPGLAEFVDFFVSEAAIGEDGFLTERGLIPLTTLNLKALRTVVANRQTLSPNALR